MAKGGVATLRQPAVRGWVWSGGAQRRGKKTFVPAVFLRTPIVGTVRAWEMHWGLLGSTRPCFSADWTTCVDDAGKQGGRGAETSFVLLSEEVKGLSACRPCTAQGSGVRLDTAE